MAGSMPISSRNDEEVIKIIVDIEGNLTSFNCGKEVHQSKSDIFF